jgi:hypothetical protein
MFGISPGRKALPCSGFDWLFFFTRAPSSLSVDRSKLGLLDTDFCIT